jgi:sigma-B regulation protein RsbU (phosphoserine phosphatase)
VTDTKIYRHSKRTLPGVAEQLKTLQEDLEVARRIQHRLLPEPPSVPGYDIAALYQPAGEVGGDFYDFLPIDGAQHALLIADASGKGLAGALLMVEARAMIRALVSPSRTPRDILVDLNRVLLRDLDRGMFVTLFLAFLDAEQHVLSTASAGHTPMLVHRARTGVVEPHAPPGLVVGAAAEKMFVDGLGEGRLQLGPGDRALLFTDGASELMNPVQVEYGLERLDRFLTRNRGGTSAEFLRRLGDDLELHRAGQPPSDDITLLAVTRTA